MRTGYPVLRLVFRDAQGLHEFTETRVFEGERNEIREASADYALGRIAHYHAQHGAGHRHQDQAKGKP